MAQQEDLNSRIALEHEAALALERFIVAAHNTLGVITSSGIVTTMRDLDGILAQRHEEQEAYQEYLHRREKLIRSLAGIAGASASG